MNTKTCNKCKETKPAKEYYKGWTLLDGFHPWCSECHRKMTKGNEIPVPLKVGA